MFKLLIPATLLFAFNSNAQSIVSLENPTSHIISISVLKPDIVSVDKISISATYFGNESDNIVNYSPSWTNKSKVQQSTTEFDLTSFDMTKPFKVTLFFKGMIVKSFEMSRRTLINGQVLSNYETI